MREECRRQGLKRLADLAEILEKADAEHRMNGTPTYKQGAWAHPCGTPACAFGHYAGAHPEKFKIFRPRWGTSQYFITRRHSEGFGNNDEAYELAREEFCLDEDEANELFNGYGCGGAQTSKDAAKYIRFFIARECPVPPMKEGDDHVAI
jgi:hypothetical protein